MTVRLTDLNVDSRNGNVGISWKTALEENLMQFEIEYSSDGKYYHNLGFIPARNNLNGSFYEFEHHVSYSDSAFYRIKIVDNNRRWLYTEPFLYHVNKISAFFIYPSVINTGVMNIFVNDPFNLLEVISMNGTVMLKQNLSGQTGRINVPLSSTLAAGTYIVQLRNYDQTIT
ncbi:MAG TPA: T9SS type A sorting domain-containing protein, partial [Ignavibacteria bacterium]